MAQILAEHLERDSKLVEAIQYLVTDQAFHNEFLVTTVLEYLASNMPSAKAKTIGNQPLEPETTNDREDQI